jgi:hypothetical protein
VASGYFASRRIFTAPLPLAVRRGATGESGKVGAGFDCATGPFATRAARHPSPYPALRMPGASCPLAATYSA